MSLRTCLVASISVCLVTATGPVALAYQVATGITYSLPSETLSGYSNTRKDYWDPFSWDYCAWYRWDDVYGMYCEVLYIYDEYASVSAYLSSPTSGSMYLNYDDDYVEAQHSYSLSPTPTIDPNVGTWTGVGHHFYEIDAYMVYCPDAYWCYGPFYLGTSVHALGSTTQQATVCTSSSAVIDTAAEAYLRAWPAEPWESAMGVYCASDASLPLEYRNFYASFAGIHPSDDPCATWGAGGSADMAGWMHTHPWFSSANWIEEMNRGLGCGGSSEEGPITFTDYLYVYGWLHGEGAEFSPGDRSNAAIRGKPSYMKVPAGNRIMKVMPDGTESQVWP